MARNIRALVALLAFALTVAAAGGASATTATGRAATYVTGPNGGTYLCSANCYWSSTWKGMSVYVYDTNKNVVIFASTSNMTATWNSTQVVFRGPGFYLGKAATVSLTFLFKGDVTVNVTTAAGTISFPDPPTPTGYVYASVQ